MKTGAAMCRSAPVHAVVDQLVHLGARGHIGADALDALTAKRPYRDAVTFEGAIEEILPSSGKLFDPAVVEAFLKASGELKDYIGKIVFNGIDLNHNRSLDLDLEK